MLVLNIALPCPVAARQPSKPSQTRLVMLDSGKYRFGGVCESALIRRSRRRAGEAEDAIRFRPATGVGWQLAPSQIYSPKAPKFLLEYTASSPQYSLNILKIIDRIHNIRPEIE